MTDIIWAVSGLGLTMFIMGCWFGQELWKINRTLERIAEHLAENAEGERDDD